jgi:hypothetical protein
MTPATDPVDHDPDPHIVPGIIGDPGAAFSLARELADTELQAYVQHPDDEDEIEKAA